MKRPAIILVVILAGASASSALAEPVRHVPPAGGEAGTAIELVADAGSTSPTLTAHVRTTGQAQFHPIELVRRDDLRWVAVVPAAEVAAPGLDYFLDAGGTPVFASAEAPHTLPVHLAVDAERRSRDAARSEAHRSRIHTMGEWVDYGARTVNGARLADQYYRVDADLTYRLWAYPLEELRVGYTRMIGNTEAPAGTACPAGAAACTVQAGFKVGGWFELGLAPIEGIRFDARLMVIATESFNFAGRAEARIGLIDSNHVALGVEYLADVGTAGYFRLGWGSVPRTPMSATVEVTSLPASTGDVGVRLYYDVARDVGDGIKLGVRVGYAARVSSIIGFTGGLGATVDF